MHVLNGEVYVKGNCDGGNKENKKKENLKKKNPLNLLLLLRIGTGWL
jgi:predicted phosphodiesterase